MDLRLTGTMTLRSPLSHIGETISTVAYLVEEPILQPDGSLEEVFCYSGNAWRGHLRDLAAVYLLEHLGAPRLPLDSFHLLFSGGRIGGDQVVDVAAARAYRRTLPLVAVWGGGVGNQILPGKMRVSNSYPVCREALPVLPAALHAAAEAVSYRGLTFEKSFSRKDDAKDERFAAYRAGAPAPALPAAQEAQEADGAQADLFGGAPAPKARRPSATAEHTGPADQMRMSVELLAAGVQLATRIDLLDVSEVELGCLVSALHQFARSPHVGGQANKGHGLVDLAYTLADLETGEQQPFVAVTDGAPRLHPPAEAAKAAYDTFLLEQYRALLDRQGGEMRALLGVGA